MTTAGSTQGRPPGRPRSPLADEAILAAALELLAADGYRALSMEAVATRAGVGKATLYRRWSNKQELVRATLDRVGAGFTEAPPDAGSFRADFEALLVQAAQTVYVPRMAALMPRLMADTVGDEELHALFYARLVEPRREIVRTVIARAVARGEVRADVDPETAVDVLVGPLVYLIIISGGQPERVGRSPMAVFDAVYAGIATR